MSIIEDSYASKFGFEFIEDGGVSAPLGILASGVHAGFRKNTSKQDLALVVSEDIASAAATFTQNIFCAAPVRFSKEQLASTSGSPSYGSCRAVVINSGNANAATGEAGLAACSEEAQLVASAIGCDAHDVLVASTGVIGVQLPMEPFKDGVKTASEALSPDGGHDAALAIMTTDTVPKECAVKFDGTELGYPGTVFTIGGMAKGSGMIMPNMATMISVITTDAPIKPNVAYRLLKKAVDGSFNKVTVDSDTSTNDTCFLLATGKAVKKDTEFPEAQQFEPGTKAYDAFARALEQVCVALARAMAKDGEGATRLLNVFVKGAKDAHDADIAARTVANSPLVKTAIAGRDANWGRIAAALGRSGASFSQEDVNIDILGIPVCREGLALDFDEDEALRRFESPEIDIVCDLGAGDSSTCVWSCDLTHDYISINGDYRT